MLRVASLALLLLASPAALAGGIRGEVRLGIEGTRLQDVGRIVVFLERLGGASPAGGQTRTHVVRQQHAKFVPDFLVATAGDTIEMPNDDDFYHNVFSYSGRNAFDLGSYPKGGSRSITLKHAGVVRIYCAIHESMYGTVLVTPSPHHQVIDAAGHFELIRVPSGRYRVRTWNALLPEASLEVEIGAKARTPVQLIIRSSKSD